jgi:hypothetical protein
VLGHHGGWLARSSPIDLGIQPLVAQADAAMAEAAAGCAPLPRLAPPRTTRPARSALGEMLAPAVEDDWATWWPVVAYLTRVLRLADQRATSEYGGEE